MPTSRDRSRGEEVHVALQQMHVDLNVSYQVMIKGKPFGSFVPHWGPGQGDPISPYLFLIYAEGLFILIQDREEGNLIHGIKCARSAPTISHLFFLQMIASLCESESRRGRPSLTILHDHELASGQAINVDKSEVSFGRNVTEPVKNMLLGRLSFKAVETHERYLGLPTYIGK